MFTLYNITFLPILKCLATSGGYSCPQVKLLLYYVNSIAHEMFLVILFCNMTEQNTIK